MNHSLIFNPRALALQNILIHPVLVLDKCLRFSLIKIEELVLLYKNVNINLNYASTDISDEEKKSFLTLK